MKIILEGTTSELDDAVECLRGQFYVGSITECREVSNLGVYRVEIDAEVPVRDLYSAIICLKNDIPNELLAELTEMIEMAFVNRAGSIRNTSTQPYEFVFQGNGDDRGCLDLGMLALAKQPKFLQYVDSFRWVDEDPCECCDMLEIFARYLFGGSN